MKSTTQVHVHEEVKRAVDNGETLCLQKVTYVHEGKYFEPGIRFMRRGVDNKLRSQRGQANVTSLKLIKDMIREAEENWA